MALVVVTLVAGTALLMWMGELITQRGIGNGMSLLIFASVVSTLPASGGQIKAEKGTGWLIVMLGVGVAILVGIVFIEQGQRRIPVQFAKRVVGRRMYGGQSTYIPLKVNQAGVIPIIFASSVLYLPVLWPNNSYHAEAGASRCRVVDQRLRHRCDHLVFYVVCYGLLIIGFTYFYTLISFDPHQQADTIRKQGGFIPGIRPGPRPSATSARSSRASRCPVPCSSRPSRCSPP